MLIFVPSNKRESDSLFSSAFLCTNSGSISCIYIIVCFITYIFVIHLPLSFCSSRYSNSSSLPSTKDSYYGSSNSVFIIREKRNHLFYGEDSGCHYITLKFHAICFVIIAKCLLYTLIVPILNTWLKFSLDKSPMFIIATLHLELLCIDTYTTGQTQEVCAGVQESSYSSY